MPECRHLSIQTYTFDEGEPALWACNDCRLRFYPACKKCISVGHRGVEHITLDEGVDGVDCDWDERGKCRCLAATPAPLDEWQQGYDAGYKEGQEDANLIAPTPLAPGPRAIVDGCICQKCADRGDECDYGAEPNHDECSLCERGRHVRERDREDEMEQES